MSLWKRLAGAVAWADLRGRGLGMLAFALNRLTGLALAVYLFLHFGILTLLAAGPDAWDLFVRIAKSPLFLAFDVLLIAGLLIHGLNGIRVGATGLGFGVRSQKALFIGLMILAAGITLYASYRLLAGEWG